ncbi:MAG: hypothetical protein CVT48_03690 [Thermoplasmata archaeon HGW-Thermoplasmata-1]|nr:MAG: hypothetical protein CVT48_03690 [Thermoplasmata archaeon HGW-Thermoplasmata-1]
MIDNEKSKILRRASSLLAVLVFASLLLPTGVFFASAGSPDDPEITDSTDDLCLSTGSGTVEEAPPPIEVPGFGGTALGKMCDIVAAYVALEDDVVLRVAIEMVQAPAFPEAAKAGPWAFRFTVNETECAASCEADSANLMFTYTLTVGEEIKSASGHMENSTIFMTFPKVFLGAKPGENLTGMYAETGSLKAVGTIYDRAPDSGYGRDYTLMTCEANITLESSPDTGRVLSGRKAVFSITATNTGNIGADINLSAEPSASGWNAGFEEADFFLDGNNTSEARFLTVWPPEDAGVGDACVVAVSAGNATLNLTVEVVDITKPVITSDYLERGVDTKESAEFTIYVTNKDSEKWSFDLEAAASEEGWECAFEPNPLEVEGLNWAETKLTVTAPASASGPCMITVSACGAKLELEVFTKDAGPADTKNVSLPGFGVLLCIGGVGAVLLWQRKNR